MLTESSFLNGREKTLFAKDAVMTRLFHVEKGEDIAIVASGSSTPRHSVKPFYFW